MSGVVHVVGTGLAGLSTAVRLTARGQAVRIYEAAPFAGGRCRTFHDPRLSRDVDNGNHLVLSGNTSANAYLRAIGAEEKMITLPEAAFPFFDAGTGARWRVAMNDGAIPWWVSQPSRRVPGTRLWDYLRSARLAWAGAGQTVAEAVTDRGPLWQRFWEPMTWAVLNTTPDRGAASLLWRVLAETFAKGGARCRPMLAPSGLGTALVDPAVEHLARHGVEIAFGRALKGVTNGADRIEALHFADGDTVSVASEDRVVLALPPTRLKAALPWIDVPDDDSAILNAHFVVDDPALAKAPPITGLVGADTHWIFVKGDVVSLTVSAADRMGLMGEDPQTLAPRLWAETARALNLAAQPVTWRINKERRATFDQSPGGVAKRPKARTAFTNLYLAGDATDTGLPATIEGAIRSGEQVAKLASKLAA
ncbi:MAG: hydroxysqualene dehydroxylase HpnE [Pseudomonadota bacterium]